ncbi:MAG: cellulase family glycosylhydrolase [Paludibacteraceae bacterium]|nr:cellulase family glycosylhydrolase [Paludibacteraceae bacterium]
MKKNFTSTIKKMSVAALALSSFAFNASAEKLSGYTATEITAMMSTGWNLGNTFDATGGGNSLSAETSWGQPKTTQEMISAVHAAGFNTIRIPVSWGNHTTGGEEWIIDEDWMNRVKEVVDYAYNEEMFVIINIHHDNNKGNIYYMPEDDDESYIFITQIWRQIAEAFKDYDQHLVFEIMNEPRLVNYPSEWWFDINNPDPMVKEALRMINWYNQIGVDETRRNGSPENMDRVIMCPGYAACWEGCMSPEFKLPKDTIDNRLALSLHAYRPYDLCLGTGKVWLDSYAEEIDSYFKAVYDKFVVGQGVPVIIGEESCSFRGAKFEEDRLKWVDVYYSTIKKYGMPGILWDNNVAANNGGETHGHFNRKALTWYHPDFINAIMEIVDVKNVADDNSLSVSPNPATDVIYISDASELKEIELYSLDGVNVMRKQLTGNNVEVNVSILNRGVYTAVLRTENGVNVGKIILK